MRISRFVEKPRPEEASSHWISAGIIVFEPEVLGKIPSTVPCNLGFDVFPGLLASGERLYGYCMTGDGASGRNDTRSTTSEPASVWKDGFPLG